MKRKERTYSKEEKASALAVLDSNDGKAFPTAHETGIPRTTVIDWRSGKGVDEEVQGIRQEKREELSDIFERVARKYLAQAESPDVVSATKGKDAVISAATATDKVQLLRGKATSIAGSVSDIEQAKRILEWHRRFQEEVEVEERLSDRQIFELVLKKMPEFKHLTAEQLQIKEEVSVGSKGDEGTEPTL